MRLPRAVVLPLYGLALLVVFGVALSSLTRFDFWWYLKSGEYIVTTRSLPDGDPFSFTAQGRPWVNHMWLTQVLLYWLYETGGRIPIIVGKSLWVVLVFGVVLTTCLRRGAHPLIAVAVTTLAAFVGQAYWHVRPQLVTYLFLAVYLYLLRAGWEQHRRRLVWIPLLMVPWANLHAGFVAGLGLLGLVTLGEALERLLRPGRVQWRPLAALVLVSLAAAAASLLNPFGVQALLFPAEVVSSREFMSTTVEWFSPNFHDPQHRPFEVMLLLVFAGFGLGGARLRPTDLVLALTFAHLGLRSIRHIPLFAVGMAPVLAVALQGTVERVWAGRGPSVRQALAVVEARLPTVWRWARSPLTAAAVVGLYLVTLAAGYGGLAMESWTSGFVQDLNERAYPHRTMDFIKREGVPGPIFNVYVWGGYELWRLYPDYRVFFDGRTHVYGERVVRDYVEVAALRPGWKEVLDRWGIQSVLSHPGYALTEALRASDGWRLAFVDREAMLFVRGTPANQALLERIGPVTRAESDTSIRAMLAAALRDAENGEPASAISRLRAVLAADAENPVALYSLGLLLDRQGERAEAERLWRELQRVAPATELARKAERELVPRVR